MSEFVKISVAALAGIVIGGLYFGGLWRTVQAMTSTTRPTLVFLGSFLIRNIVLAAGAVAIVTFADWYHLGVFLPAVIGVRVVLVRVKGNPIAESS